MKREEALEQIQQLEFLSRQAHSEDEVRLITSQIAQITRAYRLANGIGMPAGPAEQAQEIEDSFIIRPHIEYLSDRISQAVRDVERGKNRQIAVSMPPRAGKSTLISLYNPTWMLRRHPEWKMILASHDGSLSHGWTKGAKRLIQKNPRMGVAIEQTSMGTREWQTTEGGGMLSATIRSGITGRGARVMIIDDPVRDFVEAHSLTIRNNLWDWWLSVAQTRLEPPYLVIVVMTRWHEDDFIGRLMSNDFEGNPKDWEYIRLPAIAEAGDTLGRDIGAPLLSPLLPHEDDDAAIARWNGVKESVGTYTFSAMYQQRPAPARGAVFDASWWRFWSWDPDKATDDGRVIHLDPSSLSGGQWADSWDLNFESDDSQRGGWVVGQRWVKDGARRILVSQQRGRWTFTQTLSHIETWLKPDDPVMSPSGHLVHQRLIEKKANGAAVINVLKEKVSGLKPVIPSGSKENRARAVTPEIESGHVYLPHPSDPGNEWVQDFLSEVRNFPHDAADDQVDAMTQVLSFFRGPSGGNITVPGAPRFGATPVVINRNVAAAARTAVRRGR